MSTKHLRVAAADENPFDAKAGPRSRPSVRFPVRTYSFWDELRYAARSLAIVLIGSISAFYVFAGLFFSDTIAGALFILLMVGVTGIRSSFVRSVLKITFPMVLPLYCAKRIPELVIIVPILLLAEVFRFRRHYIRLATVGMIDKKTGRWFRFLGWLPKGVKPSFLLRGFIDAVVSYLAYNRHSVKVPGAFQSPAGGVFYRHFRLAFLFVLIAITPVVSARESPEVFAMAFPVMVIVASAIWLLALFLGSMLVVGRAHALKAKQFASAHWYRLLDQICNSKDRVERDSIWLGFVDHDRTPILYPVDALFRHSILLGKTGSGKTSYLMGLLSQLIYRGDVSTVFIDLKAMGWEVLASMQDAAAAAQKRHAASFPVDHFTLDFGESTHLFDVFSQAWWKTLPPPQRTGVVLSALSLSYSRAYGQSWFTDTCYHLLHFVLSRHQDISSWRDLSQRIQDAIRHAKPWELSKEVKDSGEHVVLIVERLAAIDALNDYGNRPQQVKDAAIDFADAFTSPRHYYFALGAIRNGLLAGEVGRLVAASLLNAACAMPQRPTRVLLVIDEWQEMVASNLQILLAQARGLGVGVMLSNQHAAQLILPDCDLRPVVEGNTTLQAFLQPTDRVGREQVIALGGKYIVNLVSKHVKADEISYSLSESIVDRVDSTIISQVGSDPNRLFLRCTDNAGYACYSDLMFVARSMHHQTFAAYKRGCAMPWPAQTSETLVNSTPQIAQRPPASRTNNITPPNSQRRGTPLRSKRP